MSFAAQVFQMVAHLERQSFLTAYNKVHAFKTQANTPEGHSGASQIPKLCS